LQQVYVCCMSLSFIWKPFQTLSYLDPKVVPAMSSMSSKTQAAPADLFDGRPHRNL